jgi:predicted ATPase/DNA-binding SARP family transcriptional activator
MVLSVRLLGQVAAVRDGDPVGLGGPLQKGVLALLALAAPEPLTPDVLVAGIWGDAAPPAARESLRAYLSRLRGAVGAEHLERSSNAYRLLADDVDVQRFTELAGTGRTALEAGDLEGARSQLEEALALWEGTALADVRHLPFAGAPAAGLEEARAAAREDLHDAQLRAGTHAEAIGALQALVEAAPLRERAVGLLMLARYRSGQQAEALAAYTQLRSRLVEELGIEPAPEVQLLHQQILSQDPALRTTPAASAGAPSTAPVAASADTSGVAGAGAAGVGAAEAGAAAPPAGNVPTPLTSFVGRTEELAAGRALLDAHRLVTLVGPGGSGKTRLALELVRGMATDLVDGPWLVELAGVDEGDLVPSAVAGVLGVAATSEGSLTDILASALADRPVLVVLDNCEHVIDAAATLAERLLRRCPGLRVLATSREPLGVPGERAVTVPALPVARREGPSDAALLFADRAAQVDPSFTLAETETPLVERICRELDGIPLAIELAAARLQLLSLEQIASMLDDRFALLTSGNRTALPRHRTLMAAVAWSYDLLDDEQRQLFAITSVFRDGFTLEALESLLPGPGTLDALGQLVAKSMVTVEASGEPGSPRRYRMLETLREFAGRQLDERRRREWADAHARWCADLAEEAEGHLRSASDLLWWDRLTAEQHNLRAGLRHALDTGQHELALRLVAALSWFWYRKGPVTEGRQWLRTALEGAEGAPPLLEARARLGHAVLCYLAGDLPQARADLERSAALNDGGDPAARAMAETYLGFFEAAFGDPDVAQHRIATAQEMARQAPAWVRPEVLMTVGQLARARGNLRESVEVLGRSRAAALEAGHRWCASSSGWIAAKALLQAERPAQAAVLLAQVIVELAETGDRTSLLAGLHTMAAVAAALGHSEEGAVLMGAVDAIGDRIGYSPVRMDPVDSAAHRAAVLQRLSPSVAESARARGAALTMGDAVRLAVQIAASGSPKPLQRT